MQSTDHTFVLDATRNHKQMLSLAYGNLCDAFECLTFAVEHFERAANDGQLGPKTSPILMASRRLRDDLAEHLKDAS